MVVGDQGRVPVLNDEKILHADCALIPLYHERIYAAASPGVQGLRLHQTPPQVRFENLWVDKDV